MIKNIADCSLAKGGGLDVPGNQSKNRNCNKNLKELASSKYLKNPLELLIEPNQNNNVSNVKTKAYLPAAVFFKMICSSDCLDIRDFSLKNTISVLARGHLSQLNGEIKAILSPIYVSSDTQ